MSESRRRIILGIALVGAIIYALNYYIPKWTSDDGPRPNTTQTAAVTTPIPSPAALHTQAAVVQISLEDERAKDWGSDPFRSRKVTRVPTKQVGKVSVPWTLTGIVLGGTEPMAIINSRGVSEGDEIAGGKVISIGTDSVILERAGQKYTLRVNKG